MLIRQVISVFVLVLSWTSLLGINAAEVNSDLFWVANGGGVRAWFANMGFAQAFRDVGLFEADAESHSKFASFSTNSGSTYFGVLFFFSQPFYDNITQGTPEELRQFSVELLTSLEGLLINTESDPSACDSRADTVQIPGLEQTKLLCEFMTRFNGSWSNYTYHQLEAVASGYGDETFADRLAIPSNRIPQLSTTNFFVQSAFSPATRIGNTVTYYGPDAEDNNEEIYRIPLSIAYGVKESSHGWVTATTTDRILGHVYPAPDTYNRTADWEPIFGSWATSSPKFGRVSMPANETGILDSPPLETFEWTAPWNDMPTVSQATGASTSVFGFLTGVAPQMMTTFASVLDYSINNDVDLPGEERERLLLVLENTTKHSYQSGDSDGFMMCSNEPCEKDSSLLADGAFGELTSFAHSLGEYQKDKGYENLTTVKVIFTDHKVETFGALGFLSLWSTAFNQGIAPGEAMWPPADQFGGFPTPLRSAQIFEEYLDDPELELQLKTVGSSPLKAAVLKGVTVDNPFYGIRAGQPVEIFYVQTNSPLPAELLVGGVLSLLRDQYALLAQDISSNAALKEQLDDFLSADVGEETSSGSSVRAGTCSVLTALATWFVWYLNQ